MRTMVVASCERQIVSCQLGMSPRMWHRPETKVSGYLDEVRLRGLALYIVLSSANLLPFLVPEGGLCLNSPRL